MIPKICYLELLMFPWKSLKLLKGIIFLESEDNFRVYFTINELNMIKSSSSLLISSPTLNFLFLPLKTFLIIFFYWKGWYSNTPFSHLSQRKGWHFSSNIPRQFRMDSKIHRLIKGNHFIYFTKKIYLINTKKSHFC